MKRKITELVLILLFYLIQGTCGRIIEIGSIAPNLLIVLPVLFGFFKGKNEGMFVGFFAGIMYDLYFSSLFGFSSLVFVYIGYFSGVFYQKYEEKEILVSLAIMVLSDFVFEILSYVGNFLLHNRLNIGFFMSKFILPEVVYTLLVFMIVYYPVFRLNTVLDRSRKDKRSKSNLDERNI